LNDEHFDLHELYCKVPAVHLNVYSTLQLSLKKLERKMITIENGGEK